MHFANVPIHPLFNRDGSRISDLVVIATNMKNNCSGRTIVRMEFLFIVTEGGSKLKISTKSTSENPPDRNNVTRCCKTLSSWSSNVLFAQ